jgi:HEAT repeat protein
MFLAWVPIVGLGCFDSTPKAETLTDSVNRLIGELAADEAGRRVDAAKALARLGHDASSAIPALLQHAGDPNPKVRVWVVIAVRRIAPEAPGVMGALISALEDRDQSVRREAVLLFCGMGAEAKPAVPALKKMMFNRQDDDLFPFRTEAAKAVMRITPDNTDVIPALCRMLEEPKPRIRIDAARVLGTLKDKSVGAVPVLANRLKDHEPDVRQAAAQALGDIGSKAKEAVPALAQALKDPSGDVREFVAQALGYIGAAAKGAVPALAEALDNNDPTLKAKSLGAFERIGVDAKAGMPAVFRALEDTDPTIRGYAAQALFTIGPDFQNLPALLNRLKDANPHVRSTIVAVISQVADKDKRAIPILKKLSENEDPEIRSAARKILQSGPHK